MKLSWVDRNALQLSAIHPVLRSRAERMLDDLNLIDIPCLVTQGLRSWSQQDRLYAKGRDIKSDVPCKHGPVGTCKVHPLGATVTNAPGGHSWHNFGLAFDVVPDDIKIPELQPDWNVGHAAWQQVERIGKLHELAAGAEWRTYPDYPHFQPIEIPASPDDEVRQLFKDGGTVAVWEWFDTLIKANV